MNNNNFWSGVRKHNAELLASQIVSRGGTCDGSVSSIIENIRFLAETGESFGEEKKFLRLDVRRALASLCDSGKIIFKPINIVWSDDKKTVTVGGYLYEVQNDGSENITSSYAVGGATLEDVYAQEMMSDAKRYSSLLALASARAESNALFNAGIGIEFKGGDVFNLEALEQQIPATEPVMPTPVSQEERKARRGRPKKEAASAAETTASEAGPVATVEISNATAEPAPEITTIPDAVAENAVQDTPASTSEGELSYEEAIKEVIDVGGYKGSTIGEILAKPQTARNIVWCYKQDPEGRSPRTKEALRVAIEGYNGGVLKRFA